MFVLTVRETGLCRRYFRIAGVRHARFGTESPGMGAVEIEKVPDDAQIGIHRLLFDVEFEIGLAMVS